MRYKIKKIAKRNNLNYSVVNFEGGFKGYEFCALCPEYFPAYENIYNEAA